MRMEESGHGRENRKEQCRRNRVRGSTISAGGGRASDMHIAEAYLRRLKGYEEAVNVMRDRAAYSLHRQGKSFLSDGLSYELKVMEDEAEQVRVELFKSLDAMRDSLGRKLLWMIYIEGLQPYEVTERLGIPKEDVRRIRCRALRNLPVPDGFKEQARQM